MLFGALLGLFEGRDGNARLPALLLGVVEGVEFHAPDVPVAAHFDFQPLGKGVGDGRAHAVQAAREGIVVLVELAARVQLRKNDLYARNFGLGVDVGGDAAAVVAHGGAAVLVKDDVDAVRKAVGGLVDGVVDDLPQNVMEAFGARRADVHAGAQAHGLQPFEDGDVPRVVMCAHTFLCLPSPRKTRSAAKRVQYRNNITHIIPYLVVRGNRFPQFLQKRQKRAQTKTPLSRRLTAKKLTVSR